MKTEAQCVKTCHECNGEAKILWGGRERSCSVCKGTGQLADHKPKRGTEKRIGDCRYFIECRECGKEFEVATSPRIR